MERLLRPGANSKRPAELGQMDASSNACDSAKAVEAGHYDLSGAAEDWGQAERRAAGG